MKNELILIHNNLMKAGVSGESTILVADSIMRLRKMIDSLPEKKEEADRQAE